MRQVSNYLIDLKRAVIVDVEATTAIPQAEVTALQRMIATWPSCWRGRRRPVWRSSRRPCFFHHPVDALCVDRGLTFGSPLAL
jgi:hypothetical protein